jgi:37-kD nucleoid-associated bacterial protein
MIDSTQSFIHHVSVHIVGSAAKQEGLTLSEAPLQLHDEQIHRLLLKYFLSGFNTHEYFEFTFSNNDLSLNAVHQFVQRIFAAPESFHACTVDIARHLYASSQHPNIKPGDLYVAYISDIVIGEKLSKGVGIFKCENKETYLKLREFDLSSDEGINLNKLDKGCLILESEEGEGYSVLVVDQSNKSEAQFWKQDFLNIKPVSDDYHHTQNFMNLTRQYVSDQLDEEFSVSKADQIDLLNRSMDFFKSKEQFNKAAFETEVLGNADVIESFRNYGKTFQSNHEVDMADEFQISMHAVKQQAKVFKTVLKLDKNFHIYIHGNRQLVEKGYDEVMRKHFYKLYFDEES